MVHDDLFLLTALLIVAVHRMATSSAAAVAIPDPDTHYKVR